MLGKIAKHLSCTCSSQVEGHTLLIPVPRLEVQAIPVRTVRGDKTRNFSARGRVFNFDDFGAQIRKIEGGKGARAKLLDRENSDALKRKRFHYGWLTGRLGIRTSRRNESTASSFWL